MRTLNQIEEEVGKWTEHNFDYHAPQLGMAEEVGELIHAVLKREQKIRKGATPTVTAELMKDGIGDAAVFYMHWRHMINNRRILDSPEEAARLGHLMIAAGELLLDPYDEPKGNDFWHLLESFASYAGFDLAETLDEVWSKVRQRDWRRFPQTGLPKVEVVDGVLNQECDECHETVSLHDPTAIFWHDFDGDRNHAAHAACRGKMLEDAAEQDVKKDIYDCEYCQKPVYRTSILPVFWLESGKQKAAHTECVPQVKS